MAVNCSTGFRQRIIGPHSFESIFDGGTIDVYDGPQPTSANMAPTGTLIGRITYSGGLRFTRSGIFVTSYPSQVWQLQGLASGVAGWCRLRTSNDDNTDSASFPRIDGAIGLLDDVGDYQLRLPDTNLIAAANIPITTWWWLLPPFE